MDGRAEAAAAESFFKDTHLTALRELALRFVAEQVDKRLRELRSVGHVQDRLALGRAPPRGRRPEPLLDPARALDAAHGGLPGCDVDRRSASSPRTPLERRGSERRLEQNLSLAKRAGGGGRGHPRRPMSREALVRVALQNNATQIVVGKSRSPRWLDTLRGGNLVDRLLRMGGIGIDIYVVPAERAAGIRSRPGSSGGRLEASPAHEYLVVGVVLGLLTLASWFVVPFSGYLAVGFFYMLAVVVLSLRLGRGPVLAAAVVSALTWDYLFIPPIFTFTIGKLEDRLMFGTYFVVALVSGHLTSRIRAQERNERMREDRATALYHLTEALSAARTLDDAVFAALRQADAHFGATSALLMQDGNGSDLMPHFAGSFTVNEKERGVADWSWRNRKKAGRFTDTLPSAEGFHLPLVREDTAVGVLILKLPPESSLTLAQRDLAESFATQLAQLIERENLREAGEREKLLAQSEKLHRTLLDGVSHELKTPLAVLSAAVENLSSPDEAVRASLAGEIRTATRRLNRLVNNLLDQTRLESGALKPRLDWCDGHDLVNAAIDGVSELLEGHPFEVDIPKDLPLFRADAALMEQVIANLLLNSALHTPAGTPIFLTAGLASSNERIFFTVADRGPGLPAAMRERLFQKFQRGRRRQGRRPRPRPVHHPGLRDGPGGRRRRRREPGRGRRAHGLPALRAARHGPLRMTPMSTVQTRSS
jgi:two-component system sensor histidine kinase KdpD